MTKRVLSAALAFLLVALAPGLASYEACALVIAPRASAAGVAAGVPVVPRIGGLPAGAVGLNPAAGLTATLPGFAGVQSAPSLSRTPALIVPGSFLAPAPTPAAGFAAPGAAPVLPESVLTPAFSAPADAPTPADGAPARDAKTQLSASAVELGRADAPSAKAWVLERLFTGARELLGLGSGPVAETAANPLTPAPFALTAASARSAQERATPPSPIAIAGRGLNPGEKLLTAAADAPAPEAPKGDDWINWSAVKWMFTQRTISTAAFILTSIAYPFVVIPAVGPATFGALMALGPMASIALGPVNGLIVSKMDNPRKGLAYLAWLRAGLAAVLPVLALTGNISFVPLLLASIANGWQFSLLMTSESAFMAKFAGRNQLPKLTTLGFTIYFTLQVALGTLLVVGGYINSWDPMVPFWISTAVHTALGFLILAKIPDIKTDAATLAKRAAAKAEKAAQSIKDRVKAFASKAAAFFKKFWLETALFAGSVGVYVWGVPLALPVVGTIAAGSPLWMSAALLYWVTRSSAFKTVWGRGPIRNAILLSALSAALFYPFQNLALPLVATALGSKALIYGQLLGAFFFGQLIANSAKAGGLPVVAGKPLEFWIRHVVVAMGVAWASLRLFYGDPLTMLVAGAAAAAIAYGLIAVTKRLTDKGWIRFLGVGLSGAAGVAMFWGSYPAIFASVMLMGLFLGPFVSAINGYINKNSKNEERAMNFGVSGSLFNAATSIGYALMTVNNAMHGNAFPGALWPVVAVFLAAGVVFFLAPRWLPGLPENSLSSPAKKAEEPKK